MRVSHASGRIEPCNFEGQCIAALSGTPSSYSPGKSAALAAGLESAGERRYRNREPGFEMAISRKATKKRGSARNVARPSRGGADEIRDLSRAEVRELERHVKDLEDRTRYLLASTLGARIVLYYNIGDDTFTWDDPVDATLFKRKAAAQQIKSLLGSGIEIVECRVDKHDKLVRKSVHPMAKGTRGKRS